MVRRETETVRRAIVWLVSVAGLAAGVLGCGSSDATEPVVGSAPAAADADADTGDGLYPDVVGATAERNGDTFRFDVTLSSPYDTPERYADAWRVVGPDGTVLGVRELLHDHQNEQPFTRSLSGVEIPDDVDTVTIEGRDRVNGWGGATVEFELP